MIVFTEAMIIVPELDELVQSGLHTEYPGVFIDCVLHHLCSSCSAAFEPLKTAYPDSPGLDPFEHAMAILSEHLPIFQRVFQWFSLVQTDTQSLLQLISQHLTSRSHLSRFKVAVVGGVFTPDVYRILKPYLYAYLLLELNAAEQEMSQVNCFEDSVSTAGLKSKFTLSDLIQQCRGVFTAEEFSLKFLLEDLVGTFAESAFLHKTKELVEGLYTTSFLAPLETYEEAVMRGVWLPRVTTARTPCLWSSQLVYTSFYEVRKGELFCIMMDYPDSHPTVMDLKTYLMKTRALQDLINDLSKEVRR